MKKTLQPDNFPSFDPIRYESIWQKYWQDLKLFQSTPQKCQGDKEKLYLLFAFAYPSGSGLHVGHVESKTALDILARYYRMKGKEVFFPVGWDAFGLPAENFAIKTGVHPAITTKNAINTFRKQIQRLGISYDWANELATNHPEYYRWTQWLFAELYKSGLAYQGTGMVNWCPSCQTVLANEQVVEGKCERCSALVTQKSLKQWFFKITQYKDELISGLDQLDWPKPTKQQQLNWIGKKSGINITYSVEDDNDKVVGNVECFTTRPDTNFGATFVVLAPEHPLAQELALNNKEIKDYLERATHKTELERQQEGRKKSGVNTGLYARNRLNNKKMPLWISDFVLAGFGTGAVVGVPGHDRRDFEFASQFGIEVVRVVVAEDGDQSSITKIDQVQEEQGKMINSSFLDGLEILKAKEQMMDYMEKNGMGKRVVTYKLRDWLISRQRYWGAPIPVIYDPDGAPHLIDSDSLPWLLPTDVDFKPTGESPLRSSVEFQQRTEKYAANHFTSLIKQRDWDESGTGWRPEYDTMDTFVDSSWYYLRFVDARNKTKFADSINLKTWLPVNFYMIGPEHIVLHLLYSRFFTKFLRDKGYLNFDEPFLKMRHQGMILGPDGKKMSKSKGNVINPDEIVAKFGADTLRIYEMFMGPIEADKPWDSRAVAGIFRFLNRVESLVAQSANVSSKDAGDKTNRSLLTKFHQTLDKLDRDIPALKFNTAIAALMEFTNLWESYGAGALPNSELNQFIRSLAPLAPFLSEELYQKYYRGDQRKPSVHLTDWPDADPNLTKEEKITLPVQINGKLRGQLSWLADEAGQENQAKIAQAAQDLEDIKRWIGKSRVQKVIYVPGKIINMVVA